MIAFIVAELFSYQLDLYKNKPLLVVLLNGLYYSLFTCKLIISNMAKREIQIFDYEEIKVCPLRFKQSLRRWEQI